MTRAQHLLVGLLTAALVVLGSSGVALAAAAKILYVDINMPPPVAKKLKENELPPSPTVKVKVATGVQGLKASDFSLKVMDGDKPIQIPAKDLTAFKDSEEELALLVLVQGSVRFMGDPNPIPEVPGEEATPIAGAYDYVRQALDVLGRVRQKRTKVGLMIYGDRPIVKIPLGAPGNVNAEALGPQKDYSQMRSKAFKLALESAVTMLSAEPGRRVLVVIGDGGDQDANASLTDTIDKLAGASIEVYIVATSPKGIDPKDNARLVKLARVESGGEKVDANLIEQIPQAAENIAAAINNIYTVDFPGLNPADGSMLPFDGMEHDLAVIAKKDETEAVTRTLPVWNLPKVEVEEESSLLWLWILLGVVAVAGLAVAGVVIFGKKDDAEESPPQPMVAPPPVAPPPQPAAPQRTMMLGMGGGDDSMPVVGWVVPVTGPNAFQTFKLQAGRTVIGTTPECNVQIADPFMSTQHAEIIMSPSGFTLMDKGSTNGVLVNSRRVPMHELVDNDTFTCGKTDFKFKSIN